MKILLSIKPEYVDKIMSQKKKYEYRKKNMKNIKLKNIKEVIIYSTFPVGKIVGQFKIDDFLEGTPQEIWEKTSEFSGIKKEKYNDYYKNNNQCFVLKIGKVQKYKKALDLKEFNSKIKVAPQSFLYLKEV